MTTIRANPIQIASGDERPVVFTPTNLDRFVMTQDDVIKACQRHVSAEAERLELESRRQQIKMDLFSAMAEISAWGHKNRVPFISMSPRSRDIFVAVVAPDEDEGGELHQSMSDLDIKFTRENRVCLRWMMFRASEAEGVESFVDPSQQLILIGE